MLGEKPLLPKRKNPENPFRTLRILIVPIILLEPTGVPLKVPIPGPFKVPFNGALMVLNGGCLGCKRR